ncbi:hypothetical protein AGMMS49525_01630 [Bacteroidia bacterium]|nr:hypothetical protein AGMMS49525_01630 [Bacteroidia bacterium]
MSCGSTKHTAVSSEKTLFDTTAVSKFRVLIKTGQAEISGIMIVKYVPNSLKDEWRGSLINEFGVKAFDFVAPQGKCKLHNTISFLDKWYIRKTVESDFAFLLWDAANGKTVKGKHFEQLPDGDFILKNEKRDIEYSFQLIEE